MGALLATRTVRGVKRAASISTALCHSVAGNHKRQAQMHAPILQVTQDLPLPMAFS